MASSNLDSQETYKMFKFTKILTLKVAQIVVQSRQGKKISQSTKCTENVLSSSPSNLQWFNLSIPDEPDVNSEAKLVLNGEVVEALSKTFCIEISLKTADGDEMVLEIWTVKMAPGSVVNLPSISTIYYRMGIMLKSTLSISRITPAYKMSRMQQNESYKIYHKIYGGQPDLDILGENYKNVKVSELCTPIGTILIEVVYRTKMTMLIDSKQKANINLDSSNDIMVKSDHFQFDTPKKTNEKKGIDLSKPLTAGAFVDAVKIQELHEALNLQLPPEPPMATAWLLAEKEKIETKLRSRTNSDGINVNKAGCSKDVARVLPVASKAIEVPKRVLVSNERVTGLLEFPFADGSPITELANFYQECLQARSDSEEWTELGVEPVYSADSETMAQQLKMYEDAVPEFDSMVASMFSNSEHGSDHS